MSTISGVGGTTPLVTTTTLSHTENLQRRQAVDGAIAQLAYNTYVGGDGKTVNMLSAHDLSALQAARPPYADQIRALLDRSPPLSASEIRDQASNLINQFRSKFPVAARAAPVAPTPTAPTGPVMSTRDRLLRQQAVDTMVAQLQYNVFPDGSGKTINLLREGHTLTDLNAKRAPLAAEIRALLAKDPPLTPDQIKAEGQKIVDKFRSQFGAAPVGGPAAAGEVDEAARRAAMEAALAKIKGINTFDLNGETIDLVEMIGQFDVDNERSEYVDRIKALLDKQPPLTAEEITSQANGIIDEWKEAGAIIYMMVELMASMAMFGQSQMLGAMIGM